MIHSVDTVMRQHRGHHTFFATAIILQFLQQQPTDDDHVTVKDIVSSSGNNNKDYNKLCLQGTVHGPTLWPVYGVASISLR